jgi:hypothetical protein
MLVVCGCGGVWVVVGGTGGHGKNYGITISITNAGAKSPTLKKEQKSASRRDALFCSS